MPNLRDVRLLRPLVVRCLLILAFPVGLVACGGPHPASPKAEAKQVTEAERHDAIAHAQVWKQTDVASMDIRQGPQGKGALAPFAHVQCEFVTHKAEGSSPKFWCTLDEKDTVKI